MKKSKQIGFCLLSAMTLGQLHAPLSAKESRFMINGAEIQKQYHDVAWLSFQVEEERKDAVKLYVKDEAMQKQEVTSIEWIKQEGAWIGQVEVMDGEKIQYELSIEDEIYETPTFSKDTITCSMKLFENDEETGALKDTYQQDTMITFQFSDPHMDHVSADIRKDGQPLSLPWSVENEVLKLPLTNGSYDIHIEMQDTYGNRSIYEKNILVDDVLPKIQVFVNEESYVKPMISQFDQKVDLILLEEHLDFSNTMILVDGEETKITWESDESKQKTTMLFTDEGVHTIECKVQDLAGNVIEETYLFGIDRTAPEVVLQEQNEPIDDIKQIYDHEFHLQMMIQEPFLDVKESYVCLDGEKQLLPDIRDCYEFVFQDGMHTFQYHIVDLAGHVSEGEILSFLVDSTAPIIDASTSTYHKDAFDLPLNFEERNLKEIMVTCQKDQYQKDLKVDWNETKQGSYGLLHFEEEGSYELEIVAIDQANNKTIKKISFVIDQTAPIVKVKDATQKSDVLNHENGVYLTATDSFLDQKKSQIQVYRNQTLMDTQYLNDASWSHLFDEDGDYQIVWDIVDLAGNHTCGKKSFIIDQSKPYASIQITTANNTNVLPSIYVDVKDAHLKEFEVMVTENQETKVWRFQNQNQAVLTLKDHGFAKYSICVHALDIAGNEVITAPVDVIYDPNSPQIEAFSQGTFLKTDIPFITNKDMEIQWTVKDEQLAGYRYELYEQGTLLRSLESVSNLVVYKQDEKISSYQLRIIASDLAGNVIEKSFDFVIDCEKPAWKIPQTEKELSFSNRWIPEVTKLSQDMQVVHCVLKKNGVVIPYVWQEPIEDEGEYELILQVRDAAMNRWQLDPIIFSIDHSAPVIRLYDVDHKWPVEQQASLGSTLCIYLEQMDEKKREQEHFTEIWVNGKQLSLSQIQYNEQGVPYVLIKVNGSMQIMAKAVDAAGNEQKLERSIEINKEEEIKETIRKKKKQESIPDTLMLSEKEAQGDELMWIITCSLILAFGCLWYGTRKRRNHHSKS